MGLVTSDQRSSSQLGGTSHVHVWTSKEGIHVMTEVADYKVIRDVKVTLPNDHDGIDKDFVFTLPSDLLPGVPELPPGVLCCAMVGSTPTRAAKYSFPLNDTKII